MRHHKTIPPQRSYRILFDPNKSCTAVCPTRTLAKSECLNEIIKISILNHFLVSYPKWKTGITLDIFLAIVMFVEIIVCMMNVNKLDEFEVLGLITFLSQAPNYLLLLSFCPRLISVTPFRRTWQNKMYSLSQGKGISKKNWKETEVPHGVILLRRSIALDYMRVGLVIVFSM